MNNITDNFPKGPTGNKFWLTIKAICQPIALFEECRKIYGKTFSMPSLSGYPITVFVSDPADLKQVFSASANQLNSGESSRKLIQPS